jgi:hypothetical protein
VTSSKSFEEVVAAIKSAVGHPDMAEFFKAMKNAETFAELEGAVERSLGKTGLMMFMEVCRLKTSILRRQYGQTRWKDRTRYRW